MSSTILFTFDQSGLAHEYASIPNAFRSGMAIWLEMEKRYLPRWHNSSRMYSIRPKDWEEVWDLQYSPDVSVIDKICLYTTFDYCLVRRENIGKVIHAFRHFGGTTSLPEQADLLEKIPEDAVAVGWTQTDTVAGWDSLGGLDEEVNGIPYNFLKGTKHFWLFEELKKNEREGRRNQNGR